jgi:hypothetical protein
MAEPWWRWPGRLLVAGLLAGLLGLLSDLPYGAPASQGLLRLAWRTVGEQVQLCRRRSAEELSRLAPHMRQPLDCRVRTLPYRLQVRVDGTQRVARAVAPAGARGDRPLYVQEELALAPGPHRLELAFTVAPGLAEGAEGIAVDDAAQRQALERALAGAVNFAGEFQVQARPGRTILVELDEQGRRFRLRGG